VPVLAIRRFFVLLLWYVGYWAAFLLLAAVLGRLSGFALLFLFPSIPIAAYCYGRNRQ
jgi:hypothetical protein